jgi:hypothetical protein
LLGELLGNRAAHHVARRAGRKRQDEPDRLVRIALRESATAQQRKKKRRGDQPTVAAAGGYHFFLRLLPRAAE